MLRSNMELDLLQGEEGIEDVFHIGKMLIRNAAPAWIRSQKV